MFLILHSEKVGFYKKNCFLDPSLWFLWGKSQSQAKIQTKHTLTHLFIRRGSTSIRAYNGDTLGQIQPYLIWDLLSGLIRLSKKKYKRRVKLNWCLRTLVIRARRNGAVPWSYLHGRHGEESDELGWRPRAARDTVKRWHWQWPIRVPKTELKLESIEVPSVRDSTSSSEMAVTHACERVLSQLIKE